MVMEEESVVFKWFPREGLKEKQSDTKSGCETMHVNHFTKMLYKCIAPIPSCSHFFPFKHDNINNK